MMNLVPRRLITARPTFGFHSELDRLFDELRSGFGFPLGAVASRNVFAPRVDFTETEDAYRIDAELPGLDAKDIEVRLEGDVLTIRGERKDEHDEKDDHGARHRETLRGAFARLIRLPEGLDADAVSAVYKQGMLSVTLPKPPEAKPRVRSIEITSD